MAATDEVITNLLTSCFLHAFKTAFVPLTAGAIRSFSSFGGCKGNGEAVWTIYSQLIAASMIDYSFKRSASTSSSFSKS